MRGEREEKAHVTGTQIVSPNNSSSSLLCCVRRREMVAGLSSLLALAEAVKKREKEVGLSCQMSVARLSIRRHLSARHTLHSLKTIKLPQPLSKDAEY